MFKKWINSYVIVGIVVWLISLFFTITPPQFENKFHYLTNILMMILFLMLWSIFSGILVFILEKFYMYEKYQSEKLKEIKNFLLEDHGLTIYAITLFGELIILREFLSLYDEYPWKEKMINCGGLFVVWILVTCGCTAIIIKIIEAYGKKIQRSKELQCELLTVKKKCQYFSRKS